MIFKYPPLYKELYKDGMLNVGLPSSEWGTKIFPLVKLNPTLLLFASDFELADPAEIEGHIESIRDTEYPAFNPDLKLIPFGTTGAGDWICFYFNEQKGEDIPIAFVPHDNDEFKVKAKNLQNYIFREMIDALTKLDQYSNLRKIKRIIRERIIDI